MYQYKAIVSKVTDGDTFHLDVDLGFQMYASIVVRLKGVDTPEIFRPKNEKELVHGNEAKKFCEDAILNKMVLITTFKGRPSIYGRWEATIGYGKNFGTDLGAELIANDLVKRESYE